MDQDGDQDRTSWQYFDGCLLKIDVKYFQTVRLGNSQKAIGIAPLNQLLFALVYSMLDTPGYRGFQAGLANSRGSWLEFRGSWVKSRGLWVKSRGSWIKSRGSWVKSRGSREKVVGPEKEVVGPE
jgi:hypothetical protein